MTHWLKLCATACVCALAAACGDKTEPAAETAATPAAAASEAGAITGDDLRRRIELLASDEFEGRAPGSPGGEKARNYIAGELQRLGYEPIGGSYFQDVPMVETTLDPAASYLRFETPGGVIAPAFRDEAVYWTKQVEEKVSFAASDVVFVGYGIVAPEYQWNDYAGLDVKGKTVVMLINDPGFATQDPALFNGNAMTYYGRWTYKYEEAARQGAAAALIIHDTAPAAYGWNVVRDSNSGAKIDLQRADGGASRAKVEGWLTGAAAQALFAAAGLDLDALTKAAAQRGFTAAPLAGITASAELSNTIRLSVDANVVGVLRGAEAPDEYVLYMGHWDHLGRKPGVEGDDKIFNGAVDNATGVAGILEIAEKFASNAERPKRSILIAAVTAEESGLLGSAYLAESPPVPLEDIVGGVNIDGMLPSPPSKDMLVIGAGASELEDLLKQAADRRGLSVRPDGEPEKGYFYRSDHISLAKKGVPMLYADQGLDLVVGGEEAGKALSDDYRAHRYHSPADEIDDGWRFDGMVETLDILYETGAALAYSDLWPNWYEGNEFRAIRDASRAPQ